MSVLRVDPADLAASLADAKPGDVLIVGRWRVVPSIEHADCLWLEGPYGALQRFDPHSQDLAAQLHAAMAQP